MDVQTGSMPLAEALRQLRGLALEAGLGKRRARPREELAEALATLDGLAADLEARHEEDLAQAARMEAAYEETQAQLMRYRELFEFAPDAYLVTDLAGAVREANHAASELLQTRKDLLRNKPLPFFVAAEQRRDFYTALVRLGMLGVGTVRAWEVRLAPHKGPPIEAALTVTVEADREGRPAGLRWLLRDVTVRKQAEEALRQEKELADSLVDTAGAAVVQLDGNGRMTRVNNY